MKKIDPILKQYLEDFGGHTMAYSTLQDGMKHHVIDGVGYVGYMTKWFGQPLVLGDPIASPDNLEEITESFLNKHWRPAFFQISEPYAKILDSKGFDITDFGTETWVPVSEFDLKGKKFEYLRRKINRTKREGMKVEEISDITPEIALQFAEISKQWLGSQNVSEEMRFLTRPFVPETEEGVRYFIGVLDDQIVAYVGFDPMSIQGQVTGYYADISRFRNDAPNGAIPRIMYDARETFIDEHVQIISLGLSPFHRVSSAKPSFESRNNFLQSQFEQTYQDPFMDALYGFKGQSFNKSRYNGDEHKVFIATKGIQAPLQIIEAYHLQGINYVGVMKDRFFSMIRGESKNER